MENPIRNYIVTTVQQEQGLVPDSKVLGNFLLNLVRHTPADKIQIALVREQAGLTIQKAMTQQHQLSYFKNNDPIVAEMVISMLVELVAEQFNVKESFSDVQIVDCTLSILEKYWYLRPEEIMYVFKQAKLGKYGPVYNRLDTQTILTWLHKYDTDERLTQVDSVRDGYKKAEMEEQVDIHAAYQKEIAAQQENGGVPTLVIAGKERRKRQIEKLRGELSFQQYQDNYYKNRRTNHTEKE